MNQLSIFPIPTTIVNKLNAMIARFFWKSPSQTRIHWKAKEVIHQPWGQEGLAIRNIGVFNKALLMKKVWHISKYPQLLISKVFQSANTTQSWIRPTLQNLSWGRRGLLMASRNLEAACAWKVGNGTDIHVGSQAWVLGRIPTFRDCVTLWEAQNTHVSDLILPQNQGWNTRRVNKLFVPSDARLIKSLELPQDSTEPDTQYWPFTKSGVYTTKSGYNLVLQQQQHEIYSVTASAQTAFFRHLWGLNIMPKWKLFIWKMWNNCLATASTFNIEVFLY